MRTEVLYMPALLFVPSAGQVDAQRILPRMQGVEMRGDMAFDNGYYMGVTLSSYAKGGNKWVYGAEYLHMKHGYHHATIPSAQFAVEGEYYLNFFPDAGKVFLLNLGGSTLAGYETINWPNKKLYDGATLKYSNAFACDCALTLETELYLANRAVLTVSLHERFLWGGSLEHCHIQYGIDIRFMINQRVMELEQIRQIFLVGFPEGMGYVPVSRRGNDVWSRSPLRNERAVSFRVDTQRNVWFDFGIGKGGDISHPTGELTGSTDFMEQLEFPSGKPGIPPLWPLQERKKISHVSGFEGVRMAELSHEALEGYLKERDIDPAITGRFCKEVAYGIRGKRYFTIGFMNRSDGYELRNPMFKGCISPKDISYVSLSGKRQDTCCVFEGFIDFLSALVLRTVEDEDCLVLNSVSNLERSYAALEGYGKIRCSLNRDWAGIIALETLTIHFGNKVMDCSGLYDGFKDLSEYLTKAKENK